MPATGDRHPVTSAGGPSSSGGRSGSICARTVAGTSFGGPDAHEEPGSRFENCGRGAPDGSFDFELNCAVQSGSIQDRSGRVKISQFQPQVFSDPPTRQWL